MTPRKPSPEKKRPIDRMRESAGSMEVGTPEEGPITGFYKIGDKLLIIKKFAVYEFFFADEIDPKRKNPAIPNTQQRLLGIGSDSILLGRTLLAADALLKGSFLPGIDILAGRKLALQIAKDVSAMDAVFNRLIERHKKIEQELKGSKLTAGFAVPTIDNLEADIKAFIQRADHLVATMLEITRLFYGKKVKHADALKDVVANQHKDDIEFNAFATDIAPVLRRVRDFRNAVEHPKGQENVLIQNFKLGSDGKLSLPSLSLIHPVRPIAAGNILDFMRSALESLTDIFENLLGYLCDRNCQFDAVPVSVGTLTEAQRQFQHSRFAYVTLINEQVVPVSSGD